MHGVGLVLSVSVRAHTHTRGICTKIKMAPPGVGGLAMVDGGTVQFHQLTADAIVAVGAGCSHAQQNASPYIKKVAHTAAGSKERQI